MAKGSNTFGGVAEATGSNYENLVAAWYCVRILLGSAAHPDFDLPHITRVIELSLQSAAAVDDINLVTSDDGRIFVQAKRSVTLSRTADSPLGSAIDQFVRQLSSGVSLDPKGASFRALDRTRDRLVLATRGARAAKITNVLPRLLRRLRDRTGVETISHVVSSAEEREVAEVIEAQIRASWATHLGVTPSDADVGQLLRYLARTNEKAFGYAQGDKAGTSGDSEKGRGWGAQRSQSGVVFRHSVLGSPYVVTGEVHMLPAQRGQVSQ